MDYKIIWTDSAIADLNAIYSYISRDNQDAAAKVGMGIINHVKFLESFPFMGPAYPRRSSGKVRELIFGKYRIFYEVVTEPRAVNILRVWHSSQGEPEVY